MSDDNKMKENMYPYYIKSTNEIQKEKEEKLLKKFEKLEKKYYLI